MTIKEAYILIQQELETIDIFAYPEIQKEEMDKIITSCLYNMVDNIIKENIMQPDPNKRVEFEENQRALDLIDRLYVVDTELTPTLNSTASNPFYYYNIAGITFRPVLHLLQDKSKVAITCKIEGVSTAQTLVVRNRLTKISVLNNILENSLSKTAKDSPVSSYANGVIRVFYGDFTISKIYIDYIRKPVPIKYDGYITLTGDTHTSTLVDDISSTANLVIGMPITGSGIPANTTIADIVSLTSITLSATTTTTVGNNPLTIGASGTSPLELSESGCYELIKRTVNFLMKITEQSQQKIVNLSNNAHT